MDPMNCFQSIRALTNYGTIGKKVFWHSSAHVLGEAAERRFGCYLCNGPPTEDPPGFYYDMANMDGYGS